jgi:hypothetical protein
MKKIVVLVLLMMPFFFTCNSDAAKKVKVKKETPHNEVVAEYIRSLSVVYQIQKTSMKEQAENAEDPNPTQRVMDSIRNFTKLKYEMQVSINTLKNMHLKPPFETLIPTTIELYQRKYKLYDESLKTSKILVSGAPKPGVNYDKLLARAPEITAEAEINDETIFKLMPLVFALLIDEKPDDEGHMSHLTITKEQKQKYIESIDLAFGDIISEENQSKMNWTVSSAYILKSYLQKDYKCLDEWKK